MVKLIPLSHTLTKRTLYFLSPFSYSIYQTITGCLATWVNCCPGDSEVVFGSDKKNRQKVERLAASQQSAYLTLMQSSWDLKKKRKTHTHTHTHTQTLLHTGQRQLGTCWLAIMDLTCAESGEVLAFIPTCQSLWMNEWMAGYQGTPSNQTAPRPAAADSVAICLPFLSDRMLFTLSCEKAYCGCIDSGEYVKRHQEIHSIALDSNTFVWIVAVE